MVQVTYNEAFDAVDNYDSYYQKNRSHNHLSAFAQAIQQSAEDFCISEPNFYHMYLVCELIIPKESNRSAESIVTYCKNELARDIHFWQYNTSAMKFSNK